MTSPSKEYTIESSHKSFSEIIYDAHADFFTVWCGSSPLPVVVRIWMIFLLVGVMAPFAFLPHPFAIANLVGFFIILGLNGRELVRVRGINKNMGWPHVIVWVPVLVVDTLSVSTDMIDGQQLTWGNADDDSYLKARVFFVWYNLVTLGISCLFDIYDTVMYHFEDATEVLRSNWTINHLEKGNLNAHQLSDNDQV